MSILSESLDATLAGVLVDIDNDYTSDYDTSQWGQTDSVVVIGTAFDGVSSSLQPVYTTGHAKYLFGDIYDEETHREATLVAGIQDAFENGCTTVYAYRIGGKELYKDYELCSSITAKLRLSSLYPNNKVKQCAMLFDKTAGQEKISFYKPVKKATIRERRAGLVTADSTMLVTEINLNEGYDISKDSRLTELIDKFNEHQYNNCLKLSIVDRDGVDITNSAEARQLCVGAMFPGLYTLGRDNNSESMTEYTNAVYNLVMNTTDPKPYNSFEGKSYRRLVINTDVASAYPIYAENYTDLAEYLKASGVTTVKEWDFLESEGAMDAAFAPNDTDYEEVEMTNFEMYKRLGQGYAVTAIAERRTAVIDGNEVEITPRVKEAPSSDTSRVTSIEEGDYSILQDVSARYRVLTCANANANISGKLPNPNAFKVTSGKSMLLLDENIQATKKVDTDYECDPKKFTINMRNLVSTKTASKSEINTDNIAKVISSINDIADLDTMTVEAGTMFKVPYNGADRLLRVTKNGDAEIVTGARLNDELFAIDGLVYKAVYDASAADIINSISLVQVACDNTAGLAGTSAFVPGGYPPELYTEDTFKGKNYILVETDANVFVAKVYNDGAGNLVVDTLGDLDTMLSDDDEKLIVYAEDMFNHMNIIDIESAVFDGITVEELIDLLNSHNVLNQIFEFSLTTKGSENKDFYIAELLDASNFCQSVMNASHERSYDYSLHIPYRTTDNFARQFAQHCAYTEMLTYPTHGIIGVEKFTDTRIQAIQKKLSEFINWSNNKADLYAKNSVGKYLTLANGDRYAIGRNISIPCFEHYITDTDTNYKYLCNGCTAYAGLVSHLGIYRSSTSYPIGISNVLFLPTITQLKNLTAAGFVTVKNTQTKGLVITDGITMAPSDSVQKRLFVVKTSSKISDLIRQAAEPFIGLGNNTANRNSLKTAIKANLDELVGELIDSYDFTITNEKTYTTDTHIDISYEFYPINEIREVRNYVSVKSSN